ncbi:hypothetical protein [Streptomyces apocyni]|uniref:hypothetical protein n=1 Tax=Streptomyces apocyni TaxID=2654677 RepID=UPI001E544574|nr:hypothetical protein [Streptomyces apocyni]
MNDTEFRQAGELTPAHLLRYLRGRGWRYMRDFGPGRLWTLPVPHEPGPAFEVLVPTRRELRDYAERVVDVLETLSVVEERRPSDVLREMALPSADWQYLRLTPPGPSGTAPLVDLVPALTGLRDLMTSAAAAAASPQPQPVQPSQKPQRVKDFVSSVRLDQTRVGSYVLAAHTPLPAAPEAEQLSLDGSPSAPEPFERLVTRRLYAGLSCARRAAATSLRNDSLADFDAYTVAGLSANLCESLVRIGGEEQRGFSLSFAWSPELPVNQRTPHIALSSAMLTVLEEGAKDLRARLGRRDALVAGTVVRLRRERPYEWGDVTVLGVLLTEDEYGMYEYRGHPRRFRMELNPADYDKAALAHRERHEVMVQGDLEVQGTSARLRHVSSFVVGHFED